MSSIRTERVATDEHANAVLEVGHETEEERNARERVARARERSCYQLQERFGFWSEHDPRQQLLQRVRQRVAPHLHVPDGTVVGIRSPMPNAWVFRSFSEIYLLEGLLRKFAAWCADRGQALTEDKIAMIVGHELSHLEQGTEERTGDAKEESVYAETEILQRRRNGEYDADRRGLIAMANAGYNPREGIAALEFLQSFPKGFALVRTHPRDVARLRELQELIESPDTFVPNVGVAPTALAPELLQAIQREPEDQPGTALYQEAGRRDLRALLQRAGTIHDVMEIVQMAQQYDGLALAESLARTLEGKRHLAQQVFAYNVAQVVEVIRSSITKSNSWWSSGRLPMTSVFAEYAQRALRVPVVPMTAKRMPREQLQEKENNLLEHLIEKIDDAIADLAGTEDRRHVGLESTHTLQRHRKFLADLDAGRAKEMSWQVAGLSRAEILDHLQRLEGAIQKLNELKVQLPTALRDMTDQHLEQFAVQTHLPTEPRERWSAQQGNRSLVEARDAAALVAWCAANGTPFFVDSTQESLQKRAEHAGKGIVHFESTPETTWDLTQGAQRRRYLDRVAVHAAAPIAETMLTQAMPRLRRGSAASTELPHLGQIADGIPRRLQERYAGVLTPDHALAFATIMVGTMWNAKEDPDVLLRALAEEFGREECERFLRTFPLPRVETQSSGDPILLQEIGVETDRYEYTPRHEERTLRQLVWTRAVREGFAVPSPRERLEHMRQMLVRSEGYTAERVMDEIVDALHDLQATTADELRALLAPMMGLLSDASESVAALLMRLSRQHPEVPPGEMFRLAHGSNEYEIWHLFQEMQKEYADASANVRLAIWDALLDILPRWPGSLVECGHHEDHATHQERCWAELMRVGAEYVRLYRQCHPEALRIAPLQRLTAAGCVGFTEDPHTKEQLLLNDRALTEEFATYTNHAFVMLARHAVAVEDRRIPLPRDFQHRHDLWLRCVAAKAIHAKNPAATPTLAQPGTWFDARGVALEHNAAAVMELVPKEIREQALMGLLDQYHCSSDRAIASGVAAALEPLTEASRNQWPSAIAALQNPADLDALLKDYDPKARPFTDLLRRETEYNRRRSILERHFRETHASVLGNAQLSPEERLARIAALVPERVSFRDTHIERLEQCVLQEHRLPADWEAAAVPLADALAVYEFYVKAIPLVSNAALQQVYSRRADALARVHLSGSMQFVRALDRITTLYPSSSFARDEALTRLGNSELVQTPEQANDILDQLHAAQRRTTTDQQTLREQSTAESIQEVVRMLSRSERMDFLLWCSGAGDQPPRSLRALGGYLHCSFSSTPDLMFAAEPTERNELLFSLLIGENGIMEPKSEDDQMLFEVFLEVSFERLFPSDVTGVNEQGRAILRSVFKTIFTTYEPFRRAQLYVAVMESLRTQRRESTPAERIRSLLEVLGPTFIKLGQLLSEEETAAGEPLLPEDLRTELRKLKQSAQGFRRTAGIQALAAAGEFTRSATNPQPIAHVDALLGAASIKQVYRATQTDGRRVVEKVRRPSIAKHLEEDFRVVDHIVANLRAITEIPEGLETRAKRWIRDEVDFAREAANHAMIAEVCTAYADARVVRDELIATVRVPELLSHSAEHMREEEARGLTLDDLAQVREGVRVLDDVLRDRGVAAQHRPYYAAVVAGFDRVRLQAFDALAYQLFAAGRFHADLHAGNMIITPQRELIMIDLGSAGEVARDQVPALRMFFFGFTTRHAETMAMGIRAFVPEITEAQLERIAEVMEDSRLDRREQFRRTLIIMSAGGAVIHEGFEKFLKALATGAYLTRGLREEQLAVSLMTYASS
ncbi:M48 family metalloprotease [Candidatus Uhrbacteria bacterium]|nr:M48 family metalloprotease [Candidatus Uhrbacteria bacterium]